MDYDYDYLVIGGGSGGIASARRAASYGARVALVEGKRLGGTCVNVGCVPKKMMHIAAQLGEALHEARAFGWQVEAGKFDWQAFKNKKDADIVRLNGIYGANLEKSKVKLFEGFARFVDSNTVEVDGERIRGEKILIATGGKPNTLGIPGEEHAINSDGFFELEQCPQRVIVVGAGYIAVELAGIFQGLGAQTTLVVRKNSILREFDSEIARHLQEHMEHQGVEMAFSTHLRSIAKSEDGLCCTLECAAEEGERQKTVDCVLIAVGRSPNLDNLGLENTKVQRGKRGEITVDKADCTTDPAIYAVGDVTRKMELTPVAIKTGRMLADRLFAGKTTLMNYDAIATAVFAPLEIGSCGWSEDKAIAELGADKIKVYRSAFRPMKYTITGDPVKMLMKMVVERETGKVLGLHLIGPDSAEIIQGFALAVRHGLTKEDMDATVALHPTAAEEFVTMT